MKKSKLIILLKSLSKVEMRRLGDFVHSAYFNINEEVMALLNYLQTQYPSFPEEHLQKEVVYGQVFPSKKFDKKHLGHLMNYLVKLVERFLGVERLDRDTFQFNSQILLELLSRDLEKHYNFHFKNIHQGIQQYEKVGSPYYHQKYLLADIAVKHFATQEVRVFDENLQTASNALDDFYFLHKLKYSCEMLNRQAILANKFSIPFMEEVKNFLSNKKELSPLIAIYLQIYFSLSNPSENKPLEELLGLIKEHASRIERVELREIFLYAINLCLRKIRTGKREFLSITLDLYEEGIENRALFDQGYLSHFTFNNIVKLALQLKRFGWVEQFIQSYNTNIKEQFQKDAFHYNLAELNFQKKHYEEVLSHLNLVQFTDLSYDLGTRILFVKTFYECNEMDSLDSAIAAFNNYLRRNKKLALPLKKSCLNFCMIIQQLVRRNRKKKDQLEQQIKELQPLAERVWLKQVFEDQY